MRLCFLLLFMLSIFQPVLAQQTQPVAGTDPLTLQEAIDLALENNLGLKAERLNPEIDDALVIVEAGRFEPLFQLNLSNEDADIPTGSRLSGEGTLSNKNLDYNFRWDHLLPTSTSYSVVFNNARLTTNQLFTSVNPRFDSSLFANVRQPIMRNFGRDIALTPINIAKTNRLASDSRLQVRALDVQLAVTDAYLNYAFANAELEVFRQSLAYARDLYENNKKQVEVGTMAPLEVVVAEAEVATREQAIIAGEAAIENNEDRLRTLIFGDKVGGWSQEIVLPTERPTFRDININEEEAIQTALNNNPDLKALQLDLKSLHLTTNLARNRMKPLLDLTASAGWTGLGGRRLIFNDDIFNPIPIGVEPGGFGDALSSMFENPTWTAGVIIELPVGNKNAEGEFVRAELTENQTKIILEDTKQQLVQNVRIALRNINSSLKLIESSRASVVLQERKLDAERKKLNVGLSTNNIVLDFQEDLAVARSTELLAIITYLKNIAQLERYMGRDISLNSLQGVEN